MRLLKYIIFALLPGFLYACQDHEPEYLFDESPEERIEGIAKDYAEKLTAPEEGWIGYYTSVREVGGFAVLLKFKSDGNVIIKNERINFANISSREENVSWRIGVSQYPEVVFESASIFTQWHGLNFKSPSGEGMKGGEFQFFIESVSEDLIVLRSKTDRTDITRLYLRKARKIDWDFRGIDEITEKLMTLNTNSLIVDQKLIGKGLEKYVEFNGRERYMIVEGKEGEAELYRFAITRNKIVMLDTLRWGDERITEFIYDTKESTIKTTGNNPVVLKDVIVKKPDYIRPLFLPELIASNPNVLSGPFWVWTKNPELEKVETLRVILKDYPDFYGIEYLTNLKSLSIIGIFNTDSHIDISKNKKLRRLTLMLNPKLSDIKFDHLEELEEVVLTSNSQLKNIDMRTSCKNLKRFYADMCNPVDFTVNLSGASKLVNMRAQQNGWKHLDITGCTALESLMINSGGAAENHETDISLSSLTDIEGLDASVQTKLNKVFIPKSAVCGTNIVRFYKDCKKEGRNLLMMYGHSLINPETNPENIYNENTCKP